MPLKFPDTKQGKHDYLAKLETDDGFIANCCSGYPEGYKLHRASCPYLNIPANKANPINAENGTGKIWAATLPELEENIRMKQPKRAADHCACLQAKPADEYDTDMQRESHLVMLGGQVESNRSRH